MEREIWIERMTWQEIRAALAEGYDTAVIQTGSIEQHGPHLPLATDTLLGYALGDRVTRLLGKALLAPVVRPGMSEHHMRFSGTITLSADTFKAVLRDYTHSLARHGFRRIIVLWSHGGNAATQQELVKQLAVELPQVDFLMQIDPRGFFKKWIALASKEGISLEKLGIHAGEGETSMMLAYTPDQVRREQRATGFLGDLVTGDDEHTKLLREGLHVLTDNGILGDATLSTSQRGEMYLEAMAEHVVRSLTPVRP